MVLLVGCSGAGGPPVQPGDRVRLSVEFAPEAPLRYRAVSKREIVLDFDPSGTASRQAQGARQTMSEEASFVLAYRAVGTADRGGTLVEVRCESANASHSRFSGGSSADEAIAALAGKKFTIKVSATGKIFETSELEQVIHQLGEAAFGGRNDQYQGRRIKNPDMIADFIAVQWYMWDQQQSVARPSAGVAPGEAWSSTRKVLAPMPFVSRTGRNAEYRLVEVKRDRDQTVAVIKSTYTLADGPSMDWPMPYTGTFSQRGTFGFFHSYKVLELAGEGTQIFDVGRGRIISETQSYTAKVSAAIPFGGLGSNGEKVEPALTVNQTIKVELISSENSKTQQEH
jgi:hypothetical protein